MHDTLVLRFPLVENETMAVTESDIQAFTSFLRSETADGGADLTIPQLAAKWAIARETAEVVDAVSEGQTEFAAGGGRPAAEVITDIRQKLSTK